MTERKPWHRQEGETGKAFHAFMLYRDMLPKGRSLEKTRQALTRPAGYRRWLQTWCSHYQWVARVQAYDDHLAAVRAEAQEYAIVEMADRQAREGMALQTIGIKRFVDKDGKVKEGVASEMEDKDAIRAINVGVKIERTARGEPTEIVKGDYTVRPAKELTDDELAEIIQREQLEEG